ncbi:hypothetical protein DFH11DRAFT_1597359 [Phellopilus nigrolimitatus]|nr:hypothetical protein DFH11DRAFT_1597359 [Phellopilus nigrolimitatus]
MSQSLDIVRRNNNGLFVHLKEIEVLFKDGRPKNHISLKLKADSKEYKSPQFGKNDAVDWKLKDTFSVSSTAEISVSVRQHFYKTLFAEVSIKAADIVGKQSFSVEGSKGLSYSIHDEQADIYLLRPTNLSSLLSRKQIVNLAIKKYCSTVWENPVKL